MVFTPQSELMAKVIRKSQCKQDVACLILFVMLATISKSITFPMEPKSQLPKFQTKIKTRGATSPKFLSSETLIHCRELRKSN